MILILFLSKERRKRIEARIITIKNLNETSFESSSEDIKDIDGFKQEELKVSPPRNYNSNRSQVNQDLV